MTKLRTITLILLLIAMTGVAAAKTSVDLGIAGVSARQLAMGRAFTAVSDDVNAVFANPAGLAAQESWGVTSMSTRLMERADYKLVGGVYPTQLGTLGISYASVSTPAGYNTTDKGSIADAAPISYGSTIMSLSYGRVLNDIIKGSDSLGRVSLGAKLNVMADKFEGTDGSASGSSLDLGLIYKVNPQLTAGVQLKNISGSTVWDTQTREDGQRSTNVGVALEMGKALLSMDLESTQATSLLHAGLELKVLDNLALRGGIDQSPLDGGRTASDLTAGVGFNWKGFSFDYAYRADSTLANNACQYFSISYAPVEKKAEAKASARPDILKYYDQSSEKNAKPKVTVQPESVKYQVLTYYEK